MLICKRMKKKITLRKYQSFSGHKNSIYALAFSPGENCIYTGAADGYVVRWSLDKPDEGHLIAQLPVPVYSLLKNDETGLLFAGSASGNLYVIHPSKQDETRNIELHTKGIFDIKRVQQTLLCSGGDGKLSVLNETDFSLTHSLSLSEKSLRVMVIHPQKNIIATGFSDAFIRLVDLNSGKVMHEIAAHKKSVFGLAWSNDGRYLISGGRDAMLNVYESEKNYELIKSIPAHTLHIHCIQFNPDGSLFATSSMDKTIKIWDSKSIELLKVIDQARHDSHRSSVNKICWVDEQRLVSVSDDKLAMLWEIHKS